MKKPVAALLAGLMCIAFAASGCTDKAGEQKAEQVTGKKAEQAPEAKPPKKKKAPIGC